MNAWVKVMTEGTEGVLVALLLTRIVNVMKIGFADMNDGPFTLSTSIYICQ